MLSRIRRGMLFFESVMSGCTSPESVKALTSCLQKLSTDIKVLHAPYRLADRLCFTLLLS